MKQIIVLRTDLKLGKGKMIVQACHASLAAYKKVSQKDPILADEWEGTGAKKIVVKVDTERKLLELYEKVKREIPCELIRDAGLTQIPPGTITALGIGPWKDEVVDKFTKELKLL